MQRCANWGGASREGFNSVWMLLWMQWCRCGSLLMRRQVATHPHTHNHRPSSPSLSHTPFLLPPSLPPPPPPQVRLALTDVAGHTWHPSFAQGSGSAVFKRSSTVVFEASTLFPMGELASCRAWLEQVNWEGRERRGLASCRF